MAKILVAEKVLGTYSISYTPEFLAELEKTYNLLTKLRESSMQDNTIYKDG